MGSAVLLTGACVRQRCSRTLEWLEHDASQLSGLGAALAAAGARQQHRAAAGASRQQRRPARGQACAGQVELVEHRLSTIYACVVACGAHSMQQRAPGSASARTRSPQRPPGLHAAWPRAARTPARHARTHLLPGVAAAATGRAARAAAAAAGFWAASITATVWGAAQSGERPAAWSGRQPWIHGAARRAAQLAGMVTAGVGRRFGWRSESSLAGLSCYILCEPTCCAVTICAAKHTLPLLAPPQIHHEQRHPGSVAAGAAAGGGAAAAQQG